MTAIDWTALGAELRVLATDAHGYLPPFDVAYSFLLENPECFTVDGWPSPDMPPEPNIELIAAYYLGSEQGATVDCDCTHNCNCQEGS